VPPHRIPAYYSQPQVRPPVGPYAPGDGRATWALVWGVIGVALGLLAVLLGSFILLLAAGDISTNFVAQVPPLNAFALGIPALVVGPIAYFLGKSSQARIAASEGKLSGRGTASTGSVLGIVSTVLGAASTLVWLVLMLLGFFGPPPA
jgi:hypothetical protein